MRLVLILLVSILLPSLAIAQDPLRFEEEIKQLKQSDSLVDTKNLILFTGSSSIRFWQDMKSDFPNHNVFNRGFGGSEMTDLLFYIDPLVLIYKPSKIFIYEGDNDINAGKSAEDILKTADQVLSMIRAHFPNVEVVFISPKPSIARLNLRVQYEDFNRKLKSWTESKKDVYFADVWTPMLDKAGKVRTDIFIEDKLHMNRTGYDIWAQTLRPFLD